MRNKKAQVGPVGAILLFIVFIVIWFVWLAKWINEIGASVIENNGLTGVEAFFFSNLNFTILICMILGMLGFMYFASSS